MSAFAALHSSSMALMTHSHVMERISGNVANVNTVGYKAFDAHLRESLSNASARGNFFSVGSIDVRRADVQGILQTTNRNMDLAINGQGFLITNPEFDGSGTQHFTRNGATLTILGEDGNAYLGTGNNQYVLGWAADAEGTIDTAGALVPIQTDTADNIPGEVTTAASFGANVDPNSDIGHSFEVQVWSNPDADGNNDPYALVMTWELDEFGSNTWSVAYSVRGPDGTVTDLTDTTEVTFNGNGTYGTPTDPPVLTVPFADGTTSDITLDLSGMTQYGEIGFQEHSQTRNGYSEGRIVGRTFDHFGRLTGQYDNGQSRVLYQIALADFPAPQNLDDAGNTMFTLNQNAGEPLIFGIENGFSRTAIIPGALEASTVDMPTEFARMITTQRAYSSSATVYRTSDEMLRTATELK